MTKSSHISRKATAALAIIFLLPALIFFMMWSSIGLKATGLNAQEKMSTYLDYFPSWLHNISTIHIISITCCLLAIIFAIRSFSKNLLSVRVLMFLAVIIAFFILLFDVYQMV